MYIITGASGFIGSAVVWKLNEMGVEDIILVDDIEHPAKMKNLKKRKFKDAMSKSEFAKRLKEGKALPNPKHVIHMGACSSTTEKDMSYLMENNFRYSQDVAAWALSKGAHFIYASSAATYGNGEHGYSDQDVITETLQPMNGYGFSKQLFDLWALWTEKISKCVGIKFFNVFGPNEYHKGDMRSMVHKAYEQIQETGKIRLFKSARPEYKHGAQKRDFVYVKDCVDVIAWLIEHPHVNGLFNLGSGKARTWNDLAHAVFAAMNKKPHIEYFDMPDDIADSYQYFTEAEMEKLQESGCSCLSRTLEDSVKDYVQNYLSGDDPFL